MVEQVGSRTFAATERAELRAVTATRQLQPAAQPADQKDASPLRAPVSTAKALAASAPMDMERVARIRRAVEEGRFPISPATIADRLIALKFEWNKGAGSGTGNDQA